MVKHPCSGSAAAEHFPDSIDRDVLDFTRARLPRPAPGPDHRLIGQATGVPESRITDKEEVAVPALGVTATREKKIFAN